MADANEGHEGMPNIFPFIRYNNAPAAIEWLVRVFGFQKQLVVPGPSETIAHAQLSFGPGVIMLGSAKGGAAQSKGHGGMSDVEQGVYVYVADLDEHYKRTKAGGAEIAQELTDTNYGSREYAAWDLEGHLWSFGTYYPAA